IRIQNRESKTRHRLQPASRRLDADTLVPHSAGSLEVQKRQTPLADCRKVERTSDQFAILLKANSIFLDKLFDDRMLAFVKLIHRSNEYEPSLMQKRH